MKRNSLIIFRIARNLLPQYSGELIKSQSCFFSLFLAKYIDQHLKSVSLITLLSYCALFSTAAYDYVKT